MRRARWVGAWILACAFLASSAECGVREDLEAVVFGAAGALRKDRGYRNLKEDRTRWKALREAVSLMLTSVKDETTRAAEVVAETPLEPDWTAAEYVDMFAATARRLGRDHEEALALGARTAVETFRLESVAVPGTTLRSLLEVGEGLEARSGLPGVALQEYSRQQTLASAAELDLIATELLEGLP